MTKTSKTRLKRPRITTYRTIVLWWLVNNSEPKGLRKCDQTPVGLMRLVEALFPGINYYSITGFSAVMHNRVIPVLKKRYPELLEMREDSLDAKAVTRVTEFLPSEGYEWQDSAHWEANFKRLLKAA